MDRLRGRILRWGNSYGLRISKAEAERLGLRPDEDVTLLMPGEGASPPLPTYSLKGAARDHDQLFAESA